MHGGPMDADSDQLPGKLRRLNNALLSARARAATPSETIVVEASADGDVRVVHIDDRLCANRGDELAETINTLLRSAVDSARLSAREALREFQADPRIANATDTIRDAMTKPPPQNRQRSDDGIDEDGIDEDDEWAQAERIRSYFREPR